MEKKKKIVEQRERLDRTLALPDLVDGNSIRSLVKSQLLRSGLVGDIDLIVDKRTNEVSNFLDMLRSASGNDEAIPKPHGTTSNDWKLKQDTDQLRVLYREDPHGMPFHTLLLEGFADGPIDVCLCVSWESSLYKKWWPQYNFPPFKIITSDVLKKVRIGEEISLIRVKVPWPVSDREALLHYFEIEYLKEDLVLVLINTISDKEDVDISTHGFTREGIPKADGTVRLDMVGGFVLQKINKEKSYIRAIYNMDIKLDFVPASMINFVSRQLVASGHKLFQKAVGSVAASDEDYQNALRDPLYARIRNTIKKLTESEAILSMKEQANLSTTTDTSDTEIEEEWYDAMEEIPESPRTINQQEMMDTDRACLSPEVTQAKMCQNESSGKNEVRKEFQSKFVTFSSGSEAGPSMDMNGDGIVDGFSLNGWHYEGPSARDSRQHREKNRKVSDEGILKKSNGFNAEGQTAIKKRKHRKWYCCIGTSGALQ
ncbi:polyketide cyclase/dehydrase/lipid transport superfamily protein [Rhynchospora pubera]|uniref:Polyketide cyclase/dehydrase/lipid transport superfamily protein n=1 Tax=Rhynchospora pubera TaxID=906938 RepID=A0AAV8D198_9POAL|nr:polyketide cyclase/dehydrase/lipid transport superfamily protein [Rhynchospora pubera]